MSTNHDRALGPWDESEVDFGNAAERLDLGGLLVPANPGVDLQVQVDEASGRIALVTLATGSASVQVQAYAAPRSGGMWQDVRKQIAGSISSSGGLVDEVEGEFGIELRAQVKGADGNLQPARFVGIEGPRWFLRAVFLGQAARPGEQASVLEAAVRSLVVVRGSEAMPMGSPIPMRMPDAPTTVDAPSGPAPLAPFQRGPEITETR